jgi:phosphate:Na+ symporter
VLTDALIEIISLTTKAYAENDVELASRVEPLEQVIDRLTEKVRRRHIDRLKAGECTIELGFILSDILNNCERISDHCSNVAIYIMQRGKDNRGGHEYLNEIKLTSDLFKENVAMYGEKYSV